MPANILASQRTVFHDQADDLGSNVVEQKITDAPEFAACIGRNDGPANHVGRALRHTATPRTVVRTIRAD
jgi:hypothetical protein